MPHKFRAKRDIYDYQGFDRGMMNDVDRMPKGFAKIIENAIFTQKGLKNRNGFEHITNGLTSSFVWTWNASTQDVGFHREFVRSSAGKLNIFDKCFFYDSDADAEDFNGGGRTAADAGQDFLGGFYEFSTFYVYSAGKIWSVNISTGAKTEVIDIGDDIGSAYDTVVRMFPRYGQVWAVSGPNSLIFWSDENGITDTEGSQVSDQNLLKEVMIWQTLQAGRISEESGHEPVVKSMHYYGAEARGLGRDGIRIREATDYVYIAAALTEFSDDDVVYPFNRDVIYPGMTIKTSGVNQAVVTLQADAASGQNTARITRSGNELAAYCFKIGDTVNIYDTGTPSGEDRVIKWIVKHGGYIELFFEDNLSNSYTTAASGSVKNLDVVKLEMTANWDFSLSGETSIRKEVFATATINTDYDVCYDPDNDEDCDGHIRLHDIDKFKNAEAITCTYYDYNNYWQQGNAGGVYIAKEQGNIIDAIETDVGIYVFKKNPGAIYLLKGKPGPAGTAGTIDPVFIHSGITAEAGTIQATKYGIIFGSIDVSRYKQFLLPLTVSEVDKIPEITTYYNPPLTDIGDKSKTKIFRSAIVHDDSYILVCLSQTADEYPSGSNYIYLCQPYAEEKIYKGRWLRWDESINDEYVEDNPTHTVDDNPQTIGFYEFDGKLFRVYTVHDADDGGDTGEYNFGIARYGWYAGAEQPKDKLDLEIDSGSVANSVETQGFYVNIKTGKTEIPGLDLFNVKRLRPVMECTNGDLDIDVYKNYITTVLLTKNLTGLSNTSGAEEFIRWLKYNFNCQFMQWDLLFKDIASGSSEEFLIFNNLIVEYVAKSRKGNIEQAEN